jgi:hypothetical protein
VLGDCQRRHEAGRTKRRLARSLPVSVYDRG